jgi:hypothetical protein
MRTAQKRHADINAQFRHVSALASQREEDTEMFNEMLTTFGYTLLPESGSRKMNTHNPNFPMDPIVPSTKGRPHKTRFKSGIEKKQ